MPLGVVSTEQYEVELRQIQHGRTPEKKNTPPLIRALVASEAIAGVGAQVLADEFNVSKSSVSAYKNGATSTSSYNTPNEKLAEANKAAQTAIIGPARLKLMEAIDAIDLRGEIKPNIASSVARDLSAVIKNTQPADPLIQVNNNKVIVFKPRMKEEDEYEVIDVVE